MKNHKRRICLSLVAVLLLGCFLGCLCDSPTLKPRNNGADRTEDIQRKLNKYGICRFEKGTYCIRNHLYMPDGTTLQGIGYGTKLVWDDADYEGVCVTLGSDCTVENLTFEGPLDSTPTSYKNLTAFAVTEDRENFTLSNVKVQNVMSGFVSLENGMGTNNGGKFTNCTFDSCYYGINFSTHGEYNRVANCKMNHCYIGARVTGGNNIFSSCSFDNNYFGVVLADGKNCGHGSIVGCSFNHMKYTDSRTGETLYNRGYAIWADGCDNGFVITGCQIFYGMVELKNVTGMSITDCNFGRFGEPDSDIGIPFILTNSNLVLSDNMFRFAPLVYKSDSTVIMQSNNMLISDGNPVAF